MDHKKGAKIQIASMKGKTGKISEAVFGMKTASNQKNNTTFTTFWAYGVKVVLFFRFEAVFMPKTASEIM